MSIVDKTRKGVTSIYVVIFATILFGVITVSFTRIILSEAVQSSNDDLSRSAYDSALAGVEDAKAAINSYYKCVQASGADSPTCRNLNVFDDNCEDGFRLGQVLYGTNEEVKIQESYDSTSSDSSADQAYTCVLISDVTPDYRGTLSADTRTKVIPLTINGVGSSATSTMASVAKIRFSWFSDLNRGSTGASFKVQSDGKLPSATNRPIPPMIQLTLVKTGSSINISDFHRMDNSGDVVYSGLTLLPASTTNTDVTSLSADAVKSAGNASREEINSPIKVNCSTSREFACVVDLAMGRILHDGDNAVLIASLPYGDAMADFAVTMLDGSGNIVKLRGAQISVDSTGRTNQLFRRVEARLDPADLFFPYPQYALETSDTGSDSVSKYFWVTNNCWTERGACNNNGSL